MIVAVHQPHFLPWLGYLDRMRRADLFVVLDHVQFERRNYQNRTRIRLDGKAHWLTVPVRQHSQQERIADKTIDNELRDWNVNLARTLRHAYRHAAFAGDWLPRLSALLESRWERLVDLDAATLDFLRDGFGIRTPLVRSSQLDVPGARSDLILNLCRAVGADTYLAGMGGSRDYLDRDAFAAAGVAIEWQQFEHPRYRQDGTDFLPGLSSVDLLCNEGPAGGALLAAAAPPAYA